MIPIPEQVSRCTVSRKRLPRLLSRPRRRRIGGDGDMHDAWRSCARRTRKTKRRYVAVGTTKKSAPVSCVTWFTTNVRQLGKRGRRPSMYFATLAWLIPIPSFSNSPWMRGAPQRGFTSDIVRISARTSSGTEGRPRRRRLFHFQNRRKPWRCQAMTVSGFTGIAASVALLFSVVGIYAVIAYIAKQRTREIGSAWRSAPRPAMSSDVS
jgi:hypothetical protein